MKYLLVAVTACFLTCCIGNKSEKEKRNVGTLYTSGQISALGLDSTELLDINVESAVEIDVSAYLGEHSYSLDSIITEVSLVPLETNAKSIVGTINKILITESNIYIFDTFKEGGIAIFNREGGFVKRIPNGRGPGELSRLYDIDFNKATNELVAYKHSFLVFYTESGEFIKEERLPFGLMNFKILPDGYAFYTLRDQGNGHLGSFEKYQLLVTDRNFKIEYAGLKDTGFECLGNTNYFHDSEQNGFFITQKCVDTIYRYSYLRRELEAKFVLHYDNKGIPEDYLKDTYEAFKTAAQENDYYFNIGKYFDEGDHHVFSLFSWFHDYEIIIYRNKRTGNTIGGSNIRFNLNELPVIAFPKATADGYFVTWYHPGEEDLFAWNSTVIPEENKVKLQDLTIDDNPVLVFYKLKDF